MSELSGDAKRLLAAARDGMGPDAAAIARMQAGIAAAVAAAPASAAAAGTSAGNAVPIAAKAGATAATKLIVIGAIAATAIATTAVIVAMQHEPSRVQVTPQLQSNPRMTPLPQPATDDRRPLPQSATDDRRPLPTSAADDRKPLPQSGADDRSRLPQPAAASRAPVSAAAAENRAPRPTSHGPSLVRETELLDAADSAFRAGDLAGALAQVRAYDVEIGAHGQLALDAAALEVELLCRLHDPTAPAALARFDQRWPRAAARARLTTACAE